MGVEVVIIIGIIAGASVLISGCSVVVSIGTMVHITRKFKSSEKIESKDTTSVTIKNESVKEENADGSSKTIRKQEITITDIDIDTGSKFFSGSTTATRTGLQNETAEILANGGVGALNNLTTDLSNGGVKVLNNLTTEVLPKVNNLIKGKPEAEVAGIGLNLIKDGIKLIKNEPLQEVKELEDNSIKLNQEQHQIVVDHKATKEPKIETEDVADVSDILHTVIGDESEENMSGDGLVLAEQEVLGDTKVDTAGV